MRSLITVTVIGAVAVALTACGGGGGVVAVPVPPAPKLEAAFGAGFATAFQQGANTDPREPAAGDVVAVSLTTDPVPVP